MKTICELLDHKRARISWICCATLDAEGKPKILKIARIVRVPPTDGMGRLYVGVTDWPNNEFAGHYIGVASGCGYDKITAALAGARIGGVELGDHCDSKGRPTLRDLLQREGWEEIGD